MSDTLTPDQIAAHVEMIGYDLDPAELKDDLRRVCASHEVLRAERDELKFDRDGHRDAAVAWQERAEAAEAEVARLRRAAETRMREDGV